MNVREWWKSETWRVLNAGILNYKKYPCRMTDKEILSYERKTGKLQLYSLLHATRFITTMLGLRNSEIIYIYVTDRLNLISWRLKHFDIAVKNLSRNRIV